MTLMSSFRISWVLSLACFSAASTLVTANSKRGEQSQVVCSADFNWALNSQHLSPCHVTAFVWGSCFNGNWNVPQLVPGMAYTNPNSSTANLCSCSWAAYNLISACTACQGFEPAVANWAAYDESCSPFLIDSYFPSNVTLPSGTAIPFWATTNPQTWNDGRFNVDQAKLIAQENKPDLVPSSATQETSKRKTPVGAIAGGVVGGVAVLIIGGTIAFLFLRRRKQMGGDGDQDSRYPRRPQYHGRSVSDLSGKSVLVPQNMSVVGSARPGTIYTTGTHTHTGSVHSFSYVSGHTSPVRVMSPPPPSLTAQTSTREDVVEPFTLRAMSPPAPTSPPHIMRKTSESTMRTMSNTNGDASGAMAIQERYAPETNEHPRLNPPAYSPYASPASSPEPAAPIPLPPSQADFVPGHRAPREKPSVDTHQSFSSSTNGGDSLSAIEEVIGRMGLMSPVSAVGSTIAHTVATGQSGDLPSRTHKPTVSNPDNGFSS
ncbi:hypothetical protein R3P38DRAFT_1625762 [Favolaschia claudopus]|uniref:Transmembrane protein n=1 Tax=Favolaschia claudopus TaxID=2862362 RepID=A0AAW0AFD7_9AGAR